MKWKSAIGLMALALGFGGSGLAAKSQTTVVIHAGQLFDGKSDRLASKQVIVVQGERIAAVGSEGSVNIPAGAEEIDLRGADLAMVKCEGALSDHGRQVGSNRTPERFAISMRNAGIGLVNLANNHTFDAEERGFIDTLRSLSLAGIAHVGGGTDLADARKPVIVERNGIKLGFLGYTQFNNIGESAFAADGRPGIVPMDPFLMKEDIRKLRPQVDYVMVAIHWATSRSAEVSPENRAFAHGLIDAGADVILGHHPPHPKGIEVYKGKVILYAPSNVLRGHNGPALDDGYLARFTLGAKSVEKVEVLPIIGKGQPEGHTGPYDSKLSSRLLCRVLTRTGFLRNFEAALQRWTRRWRSTVKKA
jgi:hypothetical protein